MVLPGRSVRIERPNTDRNSILYDLTGENSVTCRDRIFTFLSSTFLVLIFNNCVGSCHDGDWRVQHVSDIEGWKMAGVMKCKLNIDLPNSVSVLRDRSKEYWNIGINPRSLLVSHLVQLPFHNVLLAEEKIGGADSSHHSG